MVSISQACLIKAARGDIFQWQPIEPNPSGLLNYVEQSNVLCPDGAGVTAGPSANLANLNLTMAYLPYMDLDNADLNSTNLTNADLFDTSLTDADLTNAVIVGAQFPNFSVPGDAGLSIPQLVSTASYQVHNLQGVVLEQNNLTGIDLTGQNLTNANFEVATLTNADLANAIVVGTDFGGVIGFTTGLLTSTASYKSQNLQGIGLESNDLTGIDLSGQNLTGANLGSSTLSGASLVNANLTNASLVGTTLTDADLINAVIVGAVFGYAPGFTTQQLTSTASYKSQDLQGVGLEGENLAGINFAHQNLANARITNANLMNVDLSSASLVNANLSYSDLRGANLENADVTGANFTNTIRNDGQIDGLQLASVAGLDLSSTFTVRNYHAPPGTAYTGGIHIGSQMRLGAQTTLQMVFDGPQWNSTISFDSGIPVIITGNIYGEYINNDPSTITYFGGAVLDLEVDPSVNPSSIVGDSFQLFDWTGVTPTGQFNVTTDLPSNEYQWDTSNLYTNGTVTLESVPEPASIALISIGGASLLLRRRPDIS